MESVLPHKSVVPLSKERKTLALSAQLFSPRRGPNGSQRGENEKALPPARRLPRAFRAPPRVPESPKGHVFLFCKERERERENGTPSVFFRERVSFRNPFKIPLKFRSEIQAVQTLCVGLCPEERQDVEISTEFSRDFIHRRPAGSRVRVRAAAGTRTSTRPLSRRPFFSRSLSLSLVLTRDAFPLESRDSATQTLWVRKPRSSI